jgi:hypothetical protein
MPMMTLPGKSHESLVLRWFSETKNESQQIRPCKNMRLCDIQGTTLGCCAIVVEHHTPFETFPMMLLLIPYM